MLYRYLWVLGSLKEDLSRIKAQLYRGNVIILMTSYTWKDTVLKGDILCVFSFSLSSRVLCRFFVYVEVKKPRQKESSSSSPPPRGKTAPEAPETSRQESGLSSIRWWHHLSAKHTSHLVHKTLMSRKSLINSRSSSVKMEKYKTNSCTELSSEMIKQSQENLAEKAAHCFPPLRL